MLMNFLEMHLIIQSFCYANVVFIIIALPWLLKTLFIKKTTQAIVAEPYIPNFNFLEMG